MTVPMIAVRMAAEALLLAHELGHYIDDNRRYQKGDEKAHNARQCYFYLERLGQNYQYLNPSPCMKWDWPLDMTSDILAKRSEKLVAEHRCLYWIGAQTIMSRYDISIKCSIRKNGTNTNNGFLVLCLNSFMPV